MEMIAFTNVVHYYSDVGNEQEGINVSMIRRK